MECLAKRRSVGLGSWCNVYSFEHYTIRRPSSRDAVNYLVFSVRVGVAIEFPVRWQSGW